MEDAAPRPPSGIGGWLFLLVVMFVLVLPAVGCWLTVSTVHTLGAARADFASGGRADLLQAAGAVLIVVSIAAGYMLAFHPTHAARNGAIAALWILALGVISIGTWTHAYALDLPVGESLGWVGVKLIAKTLAVAGAWTAYLLRSERALNTYRAG